MLELLLELTVPFMYWERVIQTDLSIKSFKSTAKVDGPFIDNKTAVDNDEHSKPPFKRQGYMEYYTEIISRYILNLIYSRSYKIIAIEDILEITIN